MITLVYPTYHAAGVNELRHLKKITRKLYRMFQ